MLSAAVLTCSFSFALNAAASSLCGDGACESAGERELVCLAALVLDRNRQAAVALERDVFDAPDRKSSRFFSLTAFPWRAVLRGLFGRSLCGASRPSLRTSPASARSRHQPDYSLQSPQLEASESRSRSCHNQDHFVTLHDIRYDRSGRGPSSPLHENRRGRFCHRIISCLTDRMFRAATAPSSSPTSISHAAGTSGSLHRFPQGDRVRISLSRG